MNDQSRVVVCVTLLVVFQFLALLFMLGMWRDVRRTRNDVAKIAVLAERAWGDTGSAQAPVP